MDTTANHKTIGRDILQEDISDDAKSQKIRDILSQRKRQLNVLIAGAAGCGKSSTVNAILGKDEASVGTGVSLETREISKYELGNLVLWDTPAYDDDQESDSHSSELLIQKLSESNEAGEKLIDVVLVVLDASTRDLGSAYNLLNKVLLPHLGKDNANRILLGLNQADIAMKGRNWDYTQNLPNQELVSFLQDKVHSVRERALESTGVHFEAFYYSAGFNEDGEQSPPYNLANLLFHIANAAPSDEIVESKPVTTPAQPAPVQSYIPPARPIAVPTQTPTSYQQPKVAVPGASQPAQGRNGCLGAIFGLGCLGAIFYLLKRLFGGD